MTTESRLGIGIYSVADIERILNIPGRKVRYWLNKYWDTTLGEVYGKKYSWDTEGVRSVNFYTLIEFYIMHYFTEAGIKPSAVMLAHKELGKTYNTKFPFAVKSVLKNIQLDGKRVFWDDDNGIMNLDGSKQMNFKFIRSFLTRLDFDNDHLASRFWPLGRDKSIVIDPNRKFGQPVIRENNISPEIIHEHFKAGDPIPYLANIYELTESEVNHAIEFCKAA